MSRSRGSASHAVSPPIGSEAASVRMPVIQPRLPTVPGASGPRSPGACSTAAPRSWRRPGRRPPRRLAGRPSSKARYRQRERRPPARRAGPRRVRRPGHPRQQRRHRTGLHRRDRRHPRRGVAGFPEHQLPVSRTRARRGAPGAERIRQRSRREHQPWRRLHGRPGRPSLRGREGSAERHNKHLSLELSPLGICINAVVPGTPPFTGT